MTISELLQLGKSFKSLPCQSPNIVMIGKIHDIETATIPINASLAEARK
jgi:type II secretory ATPase GspE/PulE/Tfp pilus assembly ATPase PilB-like protein